MSQTWSSSYALMKGSEVAERFVDRSIRKMRNKRRFSLKGLISPNVQTSLIVADVQFDEVVDAIDQLSPIRFGGERRELTTQIVFDFRLDLLAKSKGRQRDELWRVRFVRLLPWRPTHALPVRPVCRAGQFLRPFGSFCSLCFWRTIRSTANEHKNKSRLNWIESCADSKGKVLVVKADGELWVRDSPVRLQIPKQSDEPTPNNHSRSETRSLRKSGRTSREVVTTS
jgi:hypothetical protein